MALIIADRVKETSTTTGTGTLTLNGAPNASFQTFAAAIGNGNTCYYCISDGSNFEIGIGTVTDGAPDTLSRDTVLQSSNADAKVNWGAGTRDVFCVAPAEKLVYLDAAGNAVGVPTASATVAGIVELLTTTELLTGTDTTRAATAAAIAALWEQGSDVASAGTISLGEGGYFNITGTTTITDIDFATDKAGRAAWCKFAGALTLTNGANLILPSGANITTAAGDTACFVSEGSDVVRCVAYVRANGTALVGSSSAFTASYVSSGQTITAAGTLTLGHGLGVEPKLVTVELVCGTGDAGYSAGDVVPHHLGCEGNDPSQSNSGIAVNKTGSTNLVVRFGSSASGATIHVLHATSGALTGITNANWTAKFRAYA